MSDITDQYKQYGMLGFFKRSIKYLFRKIGIKYESYYFMTCPLDGNTLLDKWELDPLDGITRLSIEDYKKGDKQVFSPKKMHTLQEQLQNGCLAYGLTEENCLVFSCMLSLVNLYTSSIAIQETLNKDECLLLDAYCLPEKRGRNLHKRMLIYRMLQGYRFGKKKAVSIVLRENRVSIKSLKNAGFEIAFGYYVLSISNKTFTNFQKRKNSN